MDYRRSSRRGGEESFAIIFGRLLNNANLSIIRLSQKTGISRRTLENWHAGRTARPRDRNALEQIALALKLSPIDKVQFLQSAGHQAMPLANMQLPNVPTPCIGRDAEIKKLINLLASDNHRCVTIYGMGGIGKTRLAIAIGEAAASIFPGGVYFVPLTAATELADIWVAIARTLQIPLDGQEAISADLADVLRNRKALLILDNFEQLTPYAAQLEAFLWQTHSLTLLITARWSLGLSSETIFPLQGLESIADAQELFIQTAKRRFATFHVPPQQYAAIGRICTATANIPLAIELAAMWSEVYTPIQIERELKHNFSLLQSPEVGQRRSIEGAFQYAWQQLDKPTQQMAQALTIFEGAFSTEAALFVSQGSPISLRMLINCGLLTMQQPRRFMLHRLLHQLLISQMAQGGEVILDHQITQRYKTFYYDLVLVFIETYHQTCSIQDAKQLGYEWSNIRAVWNKLSQEQAWDKLCAMSEVFVHFEALNLWGEGVLFFEQALLVAPSESLLRAHLLQAIATLEAHRNNMGRVATLCTESIRLFEQHRQRPSGLYALVHLGAAMLFLGQAEKASALIQQALASDSTTQNKNLELLIYAILTNIHLIHNEYEQARQILATLLERLPKQCWAYSAMMVMLAQTMCAQGNSQQATEILLTARKNSRQMQAFMGWSAIEFLLYEASSKGDVDALYNQMVRFGDEIGNVKVVAHSLLHLGMNLTLLRQYDLVSKLFFVSLRLLFERIKAESWLHVLSRCAFVYVPSQPALASQLFQLLYHCIETPLALQQQAGQMLVQLPYIEDNSLQVDIPISQIPMSLRSILLQ